MLTFPSVIATFDIATVLLPVSIARMLEVSARPTGAGKINPLLTVETSMRFL
jgi:hypothetical protein